MKSTLLAVALLATALASPSRSESYKPTAQIGDFADSLVAVAIALSFIGWFLIGTEFSRRYFNRSGAFAVVIGFLAAAGIPSLASVAFYHDPGGGDPVGPIWKRAGLASSMFPPIAYIVCVSAIFVTRRLRQGHGPTQNP